MIKVNLAGASRKKEAKVGMKISMPTNATPIVLLLIVLCSSGGGYWWYSDLAARDAELDLHIQQAQAQKAALDNVIKQDQIYEARKKALENRVNVIEGLQRNQVSPVVALDVLSDAVNRTQYVWLSSLDQSNAILTMSGLGTSLLAIADFYTNLERTGYFRNIDVSNATDREGNFTFSLKCEFAPPRAPAPETPPSPLGGN
jgi:Tfp pilus assembly protein PilN